ncbi:hypothetical protein [Clostridium sp. AM58-1XD]|uniref:hypothetical protein n=1 Tax=Clostridium sp. AM58-1XD TaxID=2292307 RepID=UPI000E52A56F|nr:hypothetical protein [Clostridium sp. AM58-1XD]RGZ01606.1 hypothetical protein DXA13_01890 [Clostridium sp. AM58-1XD]
MGPEYLGCSDMLDVKKAGDITVHSPYPYESHLDDSLYKPPLSATDCSGCMQDCTGIWGSLYDPVNAPGTPLLCANRLVQEVTV